jgi:DNA primase
MGCALSREQEALLRRSGPQRITLLLDGDCAGRKATSEMLQRLATFGSASAPNLPENAQPDTMDEDALLAAVRPRRLS